MFPGYTTIRRMCLNRGIGLFCHARQRGALAFMVARRGNRWELVPVTEKITGGLFEEACRRMKGRPVRFVNGTALRLENGRLGADEAIECFPEGNSEEASASDPYCARAARSLLWMPPKPPLLITRRTSPWWTCCTT